MFYLIVYLRSRNLYFCPSSDAQGAKTAIWLASEPGMEGIRGKFFEDLEDMPCKFINKKSEQKLWSICEGLIR